MFEQVNEHCLDRIVRLSETREVVASEDIYDASGAMLLAKGKVIPPGLQQRLLQRKLRQPLETALTVSNAVSLNDVVASCFEQMDIYPLAKRMAGTRNAMALLRTLKDAKLAAPVRLLLTAVREQTPDEYTHNIAAILLVAGIAARLLINDHDAMLLMQAGLLYDLGLLYVDPKLHKQGNRLEPKDWKYVAAHPLIGQVVVSELTSLSSVVGICIAQHHERMDGSGYPNHLSSNRIQRLSAVLAVADAVSAMMMRGGAEASARISLALRLIPEEYDREVVLSVHDAMRGMAMNGGVGDSSCFERAEMEMLRLQRALDLVSKKSAVKDPDPMALTITRALEITLGNVTKALRATGVLDAKTQLASSLDDPELLAEMNQITYEVGWRRRNLARNIYLRAEAHGDGKLLDMFRDVIDTLDESTESAVAEPSAQGSATTSPSASVPG